MRPIQGCGAPRWHRCHVALAFLLAVLSLAGQAIADEATLNYQYDAAGNIVAIEANGQENGPTIHAIDPGFGRVGDEVAIYGQGLSGPNGATEVAFGSLPATLIDAQANRLLVSVPANATSGPLRVSVAGIEQVSEQWFHILPNAVTAEPLAMATLAANGATQSFGFLENSTQAVSFDGSQGGLLTLNLSDWTGQPSSRIDVSLIAPDGSVSALGYVTSLPGGLHLPPLAHSGKHVLLLKSASRGNLTFHLAVDDEVMIDGDALDIDADANSLMAGAWFYGEAGEAIGFGLTDLDFAGVNATLYAEIVRPSGAVVERLRCGRTSSRRCGASAWALPESGVYGVRFSPLEPDVQRYTARLWLSRPAIGNIEHDIAYSATVERPGQAAVLRFEHSSGDALRLALRDSTTSPTGRRWQYQVVSPNGQCVPHAYCNRSDAIIETGVESLPDLGPDGQYTLRLFLDNDGWTSASGSGLFTLSRDQESDVIADGEPVLIGGDVHGRRSVLSFNGEQGQSIGVGLSDLVFNPTSRQLRGELSGPSGQIVDRFQCGRSSNNRCSLDVWSLPETGNYDIRVWAQEADVQSFSANAWLSTTVQEAISANQLQLLELSRPGQNAVLSYPGQLGVSASLRVSNVIEEPDGRPWQFQLVKPDGTCLPYAGCYRWTSLTADNVSQLPEFDVDGLYSIRLKFGNNGWNSAYGSGQFEVLE